MIEEAHQRAAELINDEHPDRRQRAAAPGRPERRGQAAQLGQGLAPAGPKGRHRADKGDVANQSGDRQAVMSVSTPARFSESVTTACSPPTLDNIARIL